MEEVVAGTGEVNLMRSGDVGFRHVGRRCRVGEGGRVGLWGFGTLSIWRGVHGLGWVAQCCLRVHSGRGWEPCRGARRCALERAGSRAVCGRDSQHTGWARGAMRRGRGNGDSGSNERMPAKGGGGEVGRVHPVVPASGGRQVTAAPDASG